MVDHAKRIRHRPGPELVAGALLLGFIVLSGLWFALHRPQSLPDLTGIEDVGELKARFYGFLFPVVKAQNDRILAQRAFVAEVRGRLAAGESPGLSARLRLRRLLDEYELDSMEEGWPARVEQLWLRVDVVPPALALAQAAKESGWGRSRFARSGNNLFGQWCYEPGCGVVPAARPAGASHEVETFPSVDEAIRRYMNNLNTHERYRRFRLLRAELRSSEEGVSARALLPGLEGYSERGEAYVRELGAMLRQNRAVFEEVVGA